MMAAGASIVLAAIDGALLRVHQAWKKFKSLGNKAMDALALTNRFRAFCFDAWVVNH